MFVPPDRRDRDQGARRAGAAAWRRSATRRSKLVRRLAKDDDIAVAGPVLTQSPRLPETDLVEIAKTKSQAHLLAISGRTGIAEAVTDVLVRRGDRRGRAQRRRQSARPAVGAQLLRRWSSAPRTTACWPRRSAAPRHSAAAVPRAAAAGDRGGAAAPARRRQAGDAGRDPARAGARSRNEVGTRHVARLSAAPSAPSSALHQAGQARRGRAGRFRQGRQIRGDGRGAVAALRRCRSRSSTA